MYPSNYQSVVGANRLFFQINAAGEHKGDPDVDIECTTAATGVQRCQVSPCSGPSYIVQAFNKMQPQDAGTAGTAGCWEQLRVRRGNLELGTLFEVRQAFGYYKALMDRYAEVTGAKSREIMGANSNHAKSKHVKGTRS